jgi:hypothetical protein
MPSVTPSMMSGFPAFPIPDINPICIKWAVVRGLADDGKGVQGLIDGY